VAQVGPGTFELRRFRVALIAVVAAPWILGAVLVLFGWHYASGWVVLQLVLDVTLTVFAFRSPGGFATWWIVLRLVTGVIAAVVVGTSAYAFVYGALEAAAAVLLILLVIPAGRFARTTRISKRRERRRVRRGYAPSQYEVRRAAKRQARIERDGYL
jgi:hypothetical protein